MSEFKIFPVTETHLDEYTWQMRDKNYFRCNEITFNLKRINEENKKLQMVVDGDCNENPFEFSQYCQALRYELEKENQKLKEELKLEMHFINKIATNNLELGVPLWMIKLAREAQAKRKVVL